MKKLIYLGGGFFLSPFFIAITTQNTHSHCHHNLDYVVDVVYWCSHPHIFCALFF